MSFPRHLIREDLHDFAGYSSARTSAPATGPDGPEGSEGSGGGGLRVWLNANEAAGPSAADPEATCRRYPDPQPAALVEACADTWATAPESIVVGRGSDEIIELLVRTVCRPGADAVVVTPPTFGMYAVSARLHGTRVVEVPQCDDGDRFSVDVDAVARAVRESGARLVFLASPGNPTGTVVPLPEVARLTVALAQEAVVVVDEAYGEFAGQRSAVSLLSEHPTLVVTRTLSKAHALAGARVGVGLAHPDLAEVLRRVQAPYPVPAPVTALALNALTPEALETTRARVGATLRRRDRIGRELRDLPVVRSVAPSDANFLLVRVADVDAVLDALTGSGVIVRDLRAHPALTDAVRITVGTDEEMAEVVRILAAVPGPTSAPPTAPTTSPTTPPTTTPDAEEIR